MFKKSILIFFIVLAIVVQENESATCDNGQCYKDCIIGNRNEYGDFDLGYCYTKDANGLACKCASNKDCSDSFRCSMKCITA